MRVLIVNNLRAGQGDAGMFDYVREVSSRGAEVTLRPLTGTALGDALRDAEDFDRVVAVGGDGTVSAVAHRLRGTGIPVLPYPAGTANLLALNLRIPADPARCAEVTLLGEHVDVDLGEISFDRTRDEPATERRRRERPPSPEVCGFVINAGAGFDASIMQGAIGLKPQLGASAYLVSAMRNIEPTVSEVRLVADGVEHEVTASAVLVVNFGRIQFDLPITHGSRVTDGVFEVVVFKMRHVVELVPALLAALLDTIADHPDRAGVLETYRCSHAVVHADPPLPLQADGETLAGVTPFTARVLPLAGRFTVPSAALAADPPEGPLARG